MLPYAQEVGKKEDWAAVVTNVQMINTPFMAWLPMGKQPAQAEYLYQAESYKKPSRNSHADGTPVSGATSAGDQRVQLRSLIQYSTKAANVSKLTQDYGNNAAVADELGTEIRKQTKELSVDMENACLSAQECRIGISGVTGYMTRGVPNWIQSSAQAVYPVDSSQYPTNSGGNAIGDQINTTATASLSEDVVLNIMQGIGVTTQSNETVTAFCGPSLRRAFNNFPIFIPSSGTTINAGAYPNEIRGGAFDRGIIRYVTPFGFEVDLVTSWKNYGLDSNGNFQTGTTYNTHSGIFVHQSKWEFRWGNKPTWTQKPYEGGKYEAFCESIWQLVCWTPKGEAIYEPAT